MPNQIAKSKQPISLVIEKKLVTQLDREAEIRGITRTAVITIAIREHLKLDPVPASAHQIEEIKNALVSIRQEQQALTGLISTDNQTLQLPEPTYKKTLFGLYRKVKK